MSVCYNTAVISIGEKKKIILTFRPLQIRMCKNKRHNKDEINKQTAMVTTKSLYGALLLTRMISSHV